MFTVTENKHHRSRKAISIVAAILLFSSLLISSLPQGKVVFAATDYTAADETELRNAIADAEETASITLSGDIELTAPVVIPNGKKVTLTASAPRTVQLAASVTSTITSMFQVDAGGELTLNGDITIQPNATTPAGSTANSKTQRIIYCKGTFTMNGGVLRNLKSGTFRTAAVVVEDTGAKFYLNNGSINNNYFTAGMCAAVQIVNGGYVKMTDGYIENNTGYYTGVITTGGGVGVYARSTDGAEESKVTSTFEMHGGTIRYNYGEYGGGVNLQGVYQSTVDKYSRSYFYMYGGTITGNDAASNGAGGGVFVGRGSQMYMHDGTISDNYAYMGGGVGTYDYWATGTTSHMPYTDPDFPVNYPADFTMYGGNIIENYAAAHGGGVYLASKNNFIYKGVIEENTSIQQGGGVYVASIPYSVTLYNAVITGNSARLMGGGLWFCPTGAAELYVNNGCAVYDNEALGTYGDGAFGSAGADLALVRKGSTDISVDISDRMLGGGLTNWYKDGAASTISGELGYPVKTAVRYADTPEADRVALYNIQPSAGTCVAAIATPSEASKEYAESRAEVLIRNNTALRGGGIGANGDVITGSSEIPTKSLAITKEWGTLPEGVEPPESIQVRVLIDGKDLGEVTTLSGSNLWTETITDIPYNAQVDIAEVEIEDYTPEYVWDYDDDGITISVSIKNEYTPKISVTGTKTWEDDDNVNGNRPTPENFMLRLFQTVGTVTTEITDDYEIVWTGTDTNVWSYAYHGLPKYDGLTEIVYTVEEPEVPGYVGKGTGNDFKNTASTVSKTVLKLWSDENDVDQLRPDSVTVQLKANGVAYGTAIDLKANEGWTYTWNNLPEYRNGNRVSYTVEEVNVPEGYTAHYNRDTFVITNVHTPEVTEPGVLLYLSKVMKDEDGNLVDSGKTFTVKILDENRNVVTAVDIAANQEATVVRGLEWGKVYTIGEVRGSYYKLEHFHIDSVSIEGGVLVNTETLTFRFNVPEGYTEDQTAGRVFITMNNVRDDVERPTEDPEWPDNPEIIDIFPELVPLGNAPTDPVVPGTGDVSHREYLLSVVAAMAAGAVIVAAKRKSKKRISKK